VRRRPVAGFRDGRLGALNGKSAKDSAGRRFNTKGGARTFGSDGRSALRSRVKGRAMLWPSPCKTAPDCSGRWGCGDALHLERAAPLLDGRGHTGVAVISASDSTMVLVSCHGIPSQDLPPTP